MCSQMFSILAAQKIHGKNSVFESIFSKATHSVIWLQKHSNIDVFLEVSKIFWIASGGNT